MRESSFIDWVRSRSDYDPAAVPVGPGDDMAVVRLDSQELLVTTDQVLDGVHFILADHGARAAGHKAAARGLSDVAAMAAVPVAAVATVALPTGFARADAEAIYAGLREVCDAMSCPLVGGDVGAWNGPLAITVTAFARPGPAGPILRSGARPGDAICVTGTLGASWRSERHLTLLPRIADARTLAGRCELHAMIDLSDGLSVDLAHVCRASGAGAEVRAEAVPISPAARRMADPLAAAVGDGEDYELLFTLPGPQGDALVADQPLEAAVSRIGTIVEGAELVLIHGDGRRERLEPTGWEHRT